MITKKNETFLPSKQNITAVTEIAAGKYEVLNKHTCLLSNQKKDHFSYNFRFHEKSETNSSIE